jgi:hypothetical protein
MNGFHFLFALVDHSIDQPNSLAFTGNIAAGRAHYDQAIALYDPAKHRPLATRFGQDIAVVTLSGRSLALWLLGLRPRERTLRTPSGMHRRSAILVR